MRTLSLAVMLIFMVLLMSCSSVSVSSDYDREYDFSQFKTYRWAKSDEVNPNDELARYPLVKKRIQQSVDKSLAEKGLQKLESGDPDLVVLIHAGAKERMQVTQTGGWHRGWYDPWWGPYGGSTHVSYYEEGTLVIDLVSWDKKELAWRGMGTKTIDQNPNPDKMQQKADEIVAKIMAQYPPQ